MMGGSTHLTRAFICTLFVRSSSSFWFRAVSSSAYLGKCSSVMAVSTSNVKSRALVRTDTMNS